MDTNLFSTNQIEYMYSDSGFLSFVNHYFSSFFTCTQTIDYTIDSNSWTDDDFEVYLRIMLANLGTLRQYLSEVEKQLSSTYTISDKKYVGEIHGNLDVGKYAKQIAEKHIPKDYPCKTKTKTWVTPENVYVIYIVDYVLRLLFSFQRFLNLKSKGDGTKYQEILLINEHLTAFKAFSQKGYFTECISEVYKIRGIYGDRFSPNIYNTIVNRLIKGKIRNAIAYQNVFDWFQQFQKGSVLFVGKSNIDTLRYSDEFANKLFELWCLYMIKETFVNEFGATLLEENDIMSSDDAYIYRLSAATGGTLEIYYQKGSKLYWNSEEELSWGYIKEERKKGLHGIPDISIRYTTGIDSLVMIDIKNRIRSSGQNSEEIYKMIGYFDNFRNAFEQRYCNGVKRQGALLFRNDKKPFIEHLVNQNDYRLMVLSVSPSAHKNLRSDQFKALCKYVFDLQGINGSTAEIIGSYSKAVKQLGQSLTEADAEYVLSKENDETISRMFSYGELAKELPKFEEALKQNHFPHIWKDIANDSVRILSMAECLYSGTSSCDLADYAPLCLEYCRALEVQLNELIFSPFKKAFNIKNLSIKNLFYEKLELSRELTLGECIYLLEKCNHAYHPMTELKKFIMTKVKKHNILFNQTLPILRTINETVRRKSAHTSIMSYEELVETRQMILGIGNINLLYTLLDQR